ncbi:hypothetical protein JCM3765_004281 [Sporobolomyces pararoseus]
MAIGAGKSLSIAQKLAQAQARANTASTSNSAPPLQPPPPPPPPSLEQKITLIAKNHPLIRPLLSIQHHYHNKGKDIDKDFILKPPSSVLEGEYDARTSTTFFAFWRPKFNDGSRACDIRLEFGEAAAFDEIADNAARYSARLGASEDAVRDIARKLATRISSRLVAQRFAWRNGYCSSDYEYSRWTCKLAHPNNDIESQVKGLVDFLENCHSYQQEGRSSCLQRTVQSIKTILGEDTDWSEPPVDFDLRFIFSRANVYESLIKRLPVLQKDDTTVESLNANKNQIVVSRKRTAESDYEDYSDQLPVLQKHVGTVKTSDQTSKKNQVVISSKRTAGEVFNKKKANGKQTSVTPNKTVLEALRDFEAQQWTRLLSTLSRPLRSFIQSDRPFASIDFEGDCKKRFDESTLPVFHITTFVIGPLPSGGHALGQRLGALDGDSTVKWSYLELDRNGKKVREKEIKAGDSMILVRAIQIATDNFSRPLTHFSFSNFENKVIESAFFFNDCLGTVAKPVTTPPSSTHYQKMAGTQIYPVNVDGKDYILTQFNFAGIASKLGHQAGLPSGVANLSMFRDRLPGQDGRTIVKGVDSKRAVKPSFSKEIPERPKWARNKAKKASADISDEATFVNDLRSIHIIKKHESQFLSTPLLPPPKRVKPNPAATASLSEPSSSSASNPTPHTTPSTPSSSTSTAMRSSASDRPETLLGYFSRVPKKTAEDEKEKGGGKGKKERNEGNEKKEKKKIEVLEILDSEEEGDGGAKEEAEAEGEEEDGCQGGGKKEVEVVVIEDSDEEEKVEDRGKRKGEGKGKGKSKEIVSEESNDEEMEDVESVESAVRTNVGGINQVETLQKGKEIEIEESEWDLGKDNVEAGGEEEEEGIDVDSLGDKFWEDLQARVDKLLQEGYSKTGTYVHDR